MTEAQTDLAFALKMYGEKCVEHAKANAAVVKGTVTFAIRDECSRTYDNMVFWQNQLWICAQAVAKENATV